MIINNATTPPAEPGRDGRRTPTAPTTDASRSGGSLLTMKDPYRTRPAKPDDRDQESTKR